MIELATYTADGIFAESIARSWDLRSAIWSQLVVVIATLACMGTTTSSPRV